MRLSALVSGGKDSVFAARLCECHGWEIADLITMVPEDQDSMLFHTPNLKVVPLIAKAWGKPHHFEKVEGAGEKEEEESLAGALARAKTRGSNGVTVGAIQSGYQWARVWTAARKAGIEVFAPLWRASEESIVLGEIAMGLDIRLSSVASNGLSENLLGHRLDAEMVGMFKMIGLSNGKMNISGEGGEYETLVVSAPFLKGKIVDVESHIVRRGLQSTWIIDKAELSNH